MPNLDAAFFPALVDLGHQTNTPPEWFLNLFYLESRLDPKAGNSLGYVGLNQIASAYLRKMGVNPADYRTWSASRQLTEVAGPWLKNQVLGYLKKTPKSPGVLYALNFYPLSVKTRGDNPDSVIVSKFASSPSEVNAYNKNSGLDYDKNGTITISDLDAKLASLAREAPYQAELKKLYVYTPPAAYVPGGISMSTGQKAATFVAGGLLIGVGGMMIRDRIRKWKR